MDNMDNQTPPGQGMGKQQTPEPSPNSDQNRTLFGILSYLGPLVIIPYLLGRNNQFVKFHTKQGLVLLTLDILVWLATVVTPFFFPIWGIVNLGILVLAIIGIVNAAQGQEKELPVVGKFSSYFKF